MKKLYLILLLSAAFIAPECCAMKRVPNIFKKCFQVKNNIRKNSSSDSKIDNWNAAVMGLGMISAVGFNGYLSYEIGHNHEEDKTDSMIYVGFLTVVGDVLLVGRGGGPLGIYTAFQAACFYKGYRDGKKAREERYK